ncbi:MAG: hypothetical protein CM15mP49_35710 [Actinomycetota bacterium]|nr:MAG: hypothetical protein CM15mP49_35710 [Actinomycetota bacterium]
MMCPRIESSANFRYKALNWKRRNGCIVISVGPESIQVPIVVGLTQEEAFNRLQNQGFVNIEVRRIKTMNMMRV